MDYCSGSKIIDSCESTNETLPKEETRPKFKGLTRFQITTEPIFFLVMFPITFTTGINIDLYQRQACNVVLGTSSVDCRVAANSSEALHVSLVSSHVNMVSNLVQQICPLLFALFVGPWSDINGRKPFMVIPFLGYLVSYLIMAVMSWFPALDPMWFVIPALPICVTGSMLTQYLCGYAYLCDIFPPEKRSMRFSINWSWCQIGMLVANVTVSPIFNASGRYGYQVVFFICVAISLIGFIYVQFLLEETVEKKHQGFTSLINLTYAKDVVRAVLFKPKKGYLRIILNILIMFSVGNLLMGETTTDYLIGQIQYSWSLATYNIFSVAALFVAAISTAAVPWILRKLFKLNDTMIVLVSGTILLIAELVKVFSPDQIAFWISSMTLRQYSLIAPIINALMSDLVDSDDLGKLYSFTGLEDMIAGYVAIPLYNGFYDLLLPTREVLYTYFLSAFFGLGITVSAIWLLILDARKERCESRLNIPANENNLE